MPETKVEDIAVEQDPSSHDLSNTTIDDPIGKALDQVLAGNDNDSPAFDELTLDGLTEDDLTGATEEKVSFSEVMKGASPEVKALLKHFQADHTRKSQEFARKQKELEDRAAVLSNSEFAKGLDDIANTEVEFDPYDATSFEKRIEQEVAKRMQEMLNPLHEQVAKQEAVAAYEQFKTAHPDLENYKADVKAVLVANETMSLEQAYWIVKGKALEQASTQTAAELDSYKQAARDAGLKVGGARRGSGNSVPDSVKKQGAYAVYRWLQANEK